MNTSVLTDCKSNATPSENNINIKWLKYSAIPIKDGFLSSEVQFYMERTPVFALPEAKYLNQTFDN
jgi:hypothetical protein